jgi:hypothetical protein
MPFNINNFRADGLKLGGARPSLFQITMTPPSQLGAADTGRKLTLLARAAQIPAMTIDPIEVPYFGRKIKVAGDRTFADWTITVMNDEDFRLRSMFEAWSNEINTLISNRNSFGKEATNYKVDADVQQFSKAGPPGDSGIIRSYRFNGLFPTTIDAIALDWDNTNTIETFDVTFAYDWWEPVVVGDGIAYNATLPDDGTSGTPTVPPAASGRI